MNASKDWFVYSSKTMRKDAALFLADLFSMSHGRIAHPEKPDFDFWSIPPINIFRYKLLKNGNYDLLYYPHARYNDDGFIVEGAYWSNGYIYQVRNQELNKDNYLDEVLEINLFIDKKTKTIYDYPEPDLSFHDIINLHCPGSSVDRATDF